MSLAMLVAGATILAALRFSSYVLATRYVDHVVAYGVGAVVLGGLGVALLLRGRAARATLVGFTLLLALFWGALGVFFSPLLSPGPVVTTALSPRTAGHSQDEAVARETGLVDPEFAIYVQQVGGWRARQ